MLSHLKVFRLGDQKIGTFNYGSSKGIAKRVLAISLIFVICLGSTPAHAASLNGKCRNKGAFSLSENQLLTCKKVKGKLSWQKATRAEKASYKVILDQKLAEARQAELNDLVLNSTGSEFEAITEISIIWRNSEIQDWGKALSEFKVRVDRSRELVKAKESELGIAQTAYNQKLLEFQNAQSTRSALEVQVRSTESQLVSLKQSYDFASQNYLSAKSVSDSLYYQYQRAYNENAIILTNRVLCDFGFVSGTSCSWGNYNYNASVISQYNSALARTNSLAGSYSNSYSAYTNGLTRLSSLRSQSSAVNISITSLNNQAVSLQRDLGVRQVELTKAKSDNTAYEGKDVVVNRHLDSLANVESKLKTAIQEHNSNIDAFLQESNAIKVTLEGKSLSEVQNEEWTSLISKLKMARTKVSTSYSLVIQTSASLLEELSKATASSK
jgi:chromosome segregation ATPase